MSRRDEAVEAWAAAVDAAYNPDRYPIMAAMFRDYADAGLDAALAVLHPTVPNDAAVLDALPVGTVLRGVDQEGTAWLLHPQESFRAAGAVLYFEAVGVTEWQVIYQPKEES